MRHMRSRRILAMLLALSMIFGLLTTTAFADNGVDQNPSNVEESTAENQTVGETQKGDGTTGDSETPPTENSKQEGSKEEQQEEEVAPQSTESEVNPVSTYTDNYATASYVLNGETVTFKGETLREVNNAMRTYWEVGDGSSYNAVKLPADGTGTLTWTIYGTVQQGDYSNDGALVLPSLSGGYIYKDGTYQWKEISVVAGNTDATIVSNATYDDAHGYISNSENCTTTLTGITISGSTYVHPNGTLKFDDCNFTGVLRVPNGDGVTTVTNSKFTAAEDPASYNYALHYQGGGELTFTNNEVGAYKRGLNIDNANLTATVSGNTFAAVTDTGRSAIQITKATKLDVTNNEITLNGGNAFTLHESLLGLTTVPEISISGNTITGNGYLIYDDAAASGTEFTSEKLTLTFDSTNMVAETVDRTRGVKGTEAPVAVSPVVSTATSGTTTETVVATIGSNEYTSLDAAIKAVADGDTIVVKAGTYVLPASDSMYTGKAFTIEAASDAEVHFTMPNEYGKYIAIHNAKVTFNNIIFDYGTADYVGLAHADTLEYNKCTINGKVFLYANSETFNECTFIQTAEDYNVWTYGAKKTAFNKCIFNCKGKAVNVYIEADNAGSEPQTIEVTDVTVNSEKANKSFLNIKNNTQAYEITFSGTNTVNGLEADGTTGSNLYQVKQSEITETSGGNTVTVKEKAEDGTEKIIFEVKKQTGVAKGTEANPYTLKELGEMTRGAYIDAQNDLGGTMYVSVGDYSYTDHGVLGNGERDDTPGQTPDHSKLNAYGENGYLGEKNDGANGLNIVFVNGSITSGVTGYTSIDNIGTSLLLAVPAYTNVTFEGITFNNVMSFNYQLYTSPWSQLGELKFDGCTFNGIIIGAIAAQTLTFDGCEFKNFRNTTDANSSNPTWIRPAYGNWTKGDNEGQGGDFKSLTTINFTGNTVTSTRPVKFERIAQWEMDTTVTATGNKFDITAQDDDTNVKNVGLYFGANAKFNLVAENNTKSVNTAGLYTAVYSAPDKVSYAGLPAGTTVKNSTGSSTTLDDAYEWKTDPNKKVGLTLTTTEEVAELTNAAGKVVKFATLADAIAAATDGSTVKLLMDSSGNGVVVPVGRFNVKGLTVDFNNFTYSVGGVLVGSATTKTNAFQLLKDNKITFQNGTIAGVTENTRPGDDTPNWHGAPAIVLQNYCDLTLYKMNVVGGDETVYTMSNNHGNVVIEDTTINAGKAKGYGYGPYAFDVCGYSDYTGVSVTVKGDSKINGDIEVSRSSSNANDVNLTLEGGTISGELKIDDTIKNSSATTTITKSDTLTLAAPAGYEWKNGTLVENTAVKVAKVGSTEYETLTAAISAAKAGETVTLLADVNTPDTTYVINQNLTIDLNGKTVTGSGYDGVFQIDGKNANVLIKNGNVVAVEQSGSAGKYAMAVWACAENCELTLEGLTVTQNINHTDDKQMDMIYTSKGTIIINSGSFTSGTPAWTLNCRDAAFKDGSAKIIVNGGTFTGFDPRNNAAEGPGTSFVAEGVGVDYGENGSFTATPNMAAQVIDTDGNSVKAYKTLAEAFNAAIEGQTVKLLADTTEDVEINKSITLDLGGKTLTNKNAGKATITIANGATATVKNGSVAGGAKYYNIAVGTEAVPGGELTLIGVTATAGNNGSSMIDNWGTLTITSGTYTGGLNVVKSEEGSKLTINGGTFTLDYAPGSGYTAVILVYGDTTITGGEFIQSVTSTGQWAHPQVIATGVVEGHPAITRVTGGTFTNKKSGENIFRGIGKATSDNFEVSGGTFNKSIPESFCADGFIPTKNADGTYGVKEGKYVATTGKNNFETLEKAVSLVAKNGKITLLADVDANIEIGSTKNFTLDLNGHTINGGTGTAKATIMNNGTVTITDSSAAKTGTIKRDDNGTVGETSFYVIRNIGTMTIEQANVTNNSGYRKTNPSGSMVGSSLICNGDDDLGGTLNISGGKFEQQNFIAIKNGALGKLNVTGGMISSNQSAIQNWFEATITGGEINGQLWTDAYIKGESVGQTTIGGNAKFTGEIVMDIYGSVKPELEISGGDLNVTNWRITTAAAKAGAKPAVSGGTFSSAIPYEYCAAGYIPEDKGDGKYGVKEGTYVAEVNGAYYESLQAAIDAASRKQTVKLIADTTENVTMETPYLTLDLNGHTLNGSTGERKPALTVTARVTVMDSSADQTGKIMREDTAENSGKTSHYVIDVQGAGWLTFESGNVINDSGTKEGKGASLVRVGNDSVAKQPGLNIKGGSFQQDNFIAIKVDRGNLFLNGGTITSENSYAIENWWNATIKGGTVNGTVSTWVYSDGKAFSDLEISGGTVNGDVASITYDKAEGKTAKVTISGGTVTGTLGTYTYSNGLVPLHDPAKATIGVTGGTFDIDPTPYVVEGSTVKTNSEGKYGVEKAYLAKVGETSYYTMDEAFHAAVASGETLYLLRDYTTNSEQNSGSNSFTIDLNGFTWTYTGTDTNYAAFEINYPNVTLTVKNGTVVSNSMVGLIPSAMGGTITYDNSGLIFESVNATANGHSGIETNGNNTSDTVTLKNSTLNVPNGFGIYFPSSGTLTIDNSQITAKTLGVQVCSGSLDIKGQNAAITVNGDPVPKTENDGAIQDGAAISIVNRAGYKGLGTITVTEGTFKAKSGNAAVKAYNWANQAESDFTASDKVAISGGTFSSAVAPEYCAEGFEPKDNGDGTYGVQPDGNVAEIGSMKYKSLDEALKAAKDGETVKLLKDAELEEVVIRSGRTLDLNGHTLKADYVTYFGGNLVDNSAAHTGLLKVLSADEILFTKNKKIDAMTQIPIYSLEKQGYVFEEIVLRVAPVTNKTPGALQAVYRPRQKDGKTDLSDAQKAMFGRANGHPVTATFRLVYKYKNSNEVQTFEFDFVDTYMDIYLSQNLYMYVTVTGLDIANIETITVTPVLKSAGGQVELVGKTIDTAAVLANLIGQ